MKKRKKYHKFTLKFVRKTPKNPQNPENVSTNLVEELEPKKVSSKREGFKFWLGKFSVEQLEKRAYFTSI